MACATPPTRPALRERYDRRQQRVVVAAARVFAERGYDQTSVQELTEAMGLASGGLYHYFASKEQLLIRICDQLMEPLLERDARARSRRMPRAEDQLRALVRLWVAHVIDHRDHMLVFQQERHLIERGDAVARRPREPQAVRAAARRPPGPRAGHERRICRATAASRSRRCSGWSTTRRSGTGETAA